MHIHEWPSYAYSWILVLLFQEKIQDAAAGQGRGVLVQVLESMYRFGLGAIAGGRISKLTHMPSAGSNFFYDKSLRQHWSEHLISYQTVSLHTWSNFLLQKSDLYYDFYLSVIWHKRTDFDWSYSRQSPFVRLRHSNFLSDLFWGTRADFESQTNNRKKVGAHDQILSIWFFVDVCAG